MILRLASRGSALARWQAEHVRARLESLHPGLRVEIRIVRTTGDRVTDVPLSAIGDRGLFTKEVDQSVLGGEADAAVHSLKDLPTQVSPGLALGAILAREDPRDAYVPRSGLGATLAALPPGSKVGTSSLRRRAQLLHLRPDLKLVDLRGNLDTRLNRLAEGRYDAIILAAAGLSRLGRQDVVGEMLQPPGWLPAPGQGALAVTIRADDDRTRMLVAALDDPDARAETAAERAFLGELEGGCQVPIGALGRVTGDELRMSGVVLDLDGRTPVRAEIQGPRADATRLGAALAQRVLERGAGEILESIRRAPPAAGSATAP